MSHNSSSDRKLVTHNGRVTHYGTIAHFPLFPLSEGCQFHLHANTKHFVISTVGEFRPGFRSISLPISKNGELYESQVIAQTFKDNLFPEGRMLCIPETREWRTRESAEAGHARLIEKCLMFEDYFLHHPYPRWVSELQSIYDKLSRESRSTR